MGIDYGEKRIGVALSDESGSFAFPHSVIANCPKCATLNVAQIKKICGENDVGKIILGESLDYKGKPNPIMKKIERLKVLLEKESGLPVIYQSEVLTTKEAERIIGKTKKTDASAAALILRSYIEKGNMI
ncbi:Holliday junction resolvase RuvX [Patescibacteria group bacterium]|nr:Holliday junction resolvase RuvX [Patescibacteria group bacterium]